MGIKIHLVLFLFIGAFMLAFETKPLADDLTQKEKADIIFRDFMARMVEGGENPEKIDPARRIVIQRWVDPLKIRVVSRGHPMDDPGFLEWMKRLAIGIHAGTGLEVEIFEEARPANIFLAVDSDPLAALNQFKDEIFHRPGTLSIYEKIKTDLMEGNTCSGYGGGPRGRFIYNWSAIAIINSEDNLRTCLFLHFAFILGAQNTHVKLNPQDTVLVDYAVATDFRAGDIRWLKVLYHLPAETSMSVGEIKDYIVTHIDAL